MHGMYTVKMPHALMVSRPTHATYVRRRLVLLVFLAVMVFSFGLAARSGLADRGDGPASVSTAGRTSQVDALQGTPDGTYVVQPGDSLWSIAAQVSNGQALADYVDALVALHGGTTLTVGERLHLP